MPDTSSTPWWHRALLVTLVLLCVALRWTGIDYGLPHITNADERVYLSQYLDLREPGEVTELRPRHNAYPDLWMRVAALVPRAELASSNADASVDVALAAASSDLVFVRRCVALLASFVVVGTWLVARRFTSSGWSLAAAALSGASVLNVCHSTQARPHAVESAAIVLAVAASIAVARKGTLRASIMAALATGASIAVLQSGAAALIPFAVAHALRFRADRARAAIHFALAGALVGLIFVVAYPGVLLDRLMGRGASAQGFLTSHSVSTAEFEGGGAKAMFLAFWNHDPLLLVACTAAIFAYVVAMLARREPPPRARVELLVVLAFVVPYSIALGLFQNTYYRFVLPLVPFAAVFAVLGFRALGRAGPWVCGVLVLVQTASVVQVMRLHRAPDTCERAAAWLRENVDRASARISIAPTTDVPLLRTSSALAAESTSPPSSYEPWIAYQRTMPAATLDAEGFAITDLTLRLASQRDAAIDDPRAFLRASKARFLLLEVFDDTERPLFAALRRAAQEEGTLVASFVPEGVRARDPHGIEPYASAEYFPKDRFVWRIFDADALGPYLEIYRFGP